MDSPFENIQNDDPADSMFFRVQLLGDTKRGFAKVRKAFVQRSDEAGNRASVLSALVKGKKERAFDALMLLLALEPNTTDLRRAGFDEVVTWCSAVVWRRREAPGKRLGVESMPSQEPVCILLCLTSLMQA